jgi:hypothetical protein
MNATCISSIQHATSKRLASCARINPFTESPGPLAQSVEQLTLNPKIPLSRHPRKISPKPTLASIHAGFFTFRLCMVAHGYAPNVK